MTPAMRVLLRRLHTGPRSLDVGGEAGVDPRTARALVKRGYAFTWASGEFGPNGPHVSICAKRNDTGAGRVDGFVRTPCSCDAGVTAMRCDRCGAEATRL